MQQPDLLRSLGDIVARIRDEISGQPTEATGAPPQISGYDIRGRLGEGGMGVVYVAEDEVLGRQVAIKVIGNMGPSQPSALRQFLHEAKTMASIAHPNVVHIYSYGESDAGPYIVMERVQGESLAARLKEGPLAPDAVLDVLEQTIAGLEAAWGKGIVHRDVKPSNILLDGAGRVRVCDFGLARPVPTDVGTIQTNAGNVVGTPHYMSPEQARGEATDLRSDIYSLGVVLYEMLTGEPPITLREPAQVLVEQISGEPKTLPSDRVGRDVAELFAWMTRKNPDDRPATYEALRGRVAAIRQEARETLPVWLRWTRSWVGSAVAAMLLLVAFSVVLASWMTTPVPTTPTFRPTLTVSDFVNETGDETLDYLGTALAHAVRRGLIRNLEGFTVAPHDAAGRDAVRSPSEVRSQLAISGVLTGSAQDLRVAYRLQMGESATAEHATALGSEGSTLDLQQRLVAALVGDLRQRFDEAGDAIELSTPQTEQANTWYQRGIYYLERTESVEEADNAIDLLDAAAASDPSFAPAHAALGLAYRAKYTLTQQALWLARADASCDEAQSLDANLGEAWLCQGWVNADLGAYDRAFKDFIRAIELGGTAAAHRGLATLYTVLDNEELAEEYFLEALDRDPAYPGAYLSLGWFYATQNRYDKAVEFYRQAIDYAPDSAYASLSLGGMYFLQGRYREAVDMLSVPALSDNADALSNLGLAWFALGDFDAAIDAFERAIAQGDALYVVHGNLGRVHHVAGDEAAARAHFETAAQRAREAAAINDRAEAPRMLLAYYEAALGNTAAALQRAAEVQAIEPNSSRAEMYLWLALMRMELGDRAAAIEMLQRAVDEGYPIHEIRSAPEFEALAGEPMYRDLISVGE